MSEVVVVGAAAVVVASTAPFVASSGGSITHGCHHRSSSTVFMGWWDEFKIKMWSVVRRGAAAGRAGGGCFGGDCARAGHGEKEAFFFLKMKCI